MTDFLKFAGAALLGTVIGLFLVGPKDSGVDLQGVYSTVEQVYEAGIDVTGSGDIEVDNAVVIDSDGNVDADLTPSSYTEPYEVITADDTIAASESGKVFYIGTAGVDLTLPDAADAAGVTYRVVVSANFTTTSMTVTGPAAGATDDDMYGALEVAGAVVACSAEDTITFVNSAENPGDFVELHSDGSKWYVTGQATTSGGITCTDAD